MIARVRGVSAASTSRSSRFSVSARTSTNTGTAPRSTTEMLRYVPGFTPEQFSKVASLYEEYNFWVVFVAAFTPIPYKVITIAAGVFGINIPMFIIASVIGRGLRFFLVAGLMWKFGPPIVRFIDKYFNLLSIVFTLLLIGGFLVLKMLH